MEIRVSAAGLNFLDLLAALGRGPIAGTGSFPQFGSECSGTVVAVGEGVDHIRIADEVLAIAPSSFASFATTPARFVLTKPAQLSFEEAATLPIAFLTADYALKHAGRLKKGERVLIHSAAGGVGPEV